MSNRIEKVNSLLEREIGKIISRQVVFPNNAMVTLTHVAATPNLIEAKVFISVLPEIKFSQVLKILNSEIFNIQQKINKKLNMRPIPRIIFLQDKSTSQAGRIEELLSQLKNDKK
jgi:ribosome-binding factor A